ncbi:hypothetical protein ACU6TU_12735 [Halomonas sp. LS-001]
MLKQRQSFILDMIVKDTDGANQHWESDIDSIDAFLPERYTYDQLESLLTGGYKK